MWNVVYELGDFWDDNEQLSTMCSGKLNETWWSLTSADEQEMEETNDGSLYRFVSVNRLQSVQHAISEQMSLGLVVFMLIGVAVLALLRHCVMMMRRGSGSKLRGESDGAGAGIYGAI